MSPWTKRLQRNTRSFAPFSGVLLHCAFASLIQMNGPAAAPAATAAADFRNLRRLNVLMLSPPSMMGFRRLPCPFGFSGDEALAARRVEHVRPRKVGRKMDPIAGMAIGAILDRRRHDLAVEAAVELRVGACRLDHDDLDRKARRRQR